MLFEGFLSIPVRIGTFSGEFKSYTRVLMRKNGLRNTENAQRNDFHSSFLIPHGDSAPLEWILRQ